MKNAYDETVQYRQVNVQYLSMASYENADPSDAFEEDFSIHLEECAGCSLCESDDEPCEYDEEDNE